MKEAMLNILFSFVLFWGHVKMLTNFILSGWNPWWNILAWFSFMTGLFLFFKGFIQLIN